MRRAVYLSSINLHTELGESMLRAQQPHLRLYPYSVTDSSIMLAVHCVPSFDLSLVTYQTQPAKAALVQYAMLNFTYANFSIRQPSHRKKDVRYKKEIENRTLRMLQPLNCQSWLARKSSSGIPHQANI